MNVLHAARSRKSLSSSTTTTTTTDNKNSKAGSRETTESSSARRAAAAIHLYNDVPSFELSLDEFETFAMKRLKV
jgi:hypothetical protein